MQKSTGDQNMSKRPKKLLDQVRDTIRLKHYAMSTEKTYVAWIKRYILFQLFLVKRKSTHLTIEK